MYSEQTVYVRPLKQKPKLFAYWEGQLQTFDLFLTQEFGRPSKTSSPDLAIADKVVSRRHGTFYSSPYEVCYMDAGSTNGTLRNGEAMTANERRVLADGDVLRIHGKEDPENRLDVLMVYSTSYKKNTVWQSVPLSDEIAEICIGRGEDVSLNDTAVSRRHASFFHAEKGWAIIDHGSLNGVYLNNTKLAEPAYLNSMDVVRIAGYLFIYTGKELFYQADAAVAPPMPEENPSIVADPGVPWDQPKPYESSTPPTADIVWDGSPSKPWGRKPAPKVEPTPSTPAWDGSPSKPWGHSTGGVRPIGKSLCIDIRERNVWERAKKKTLLKDIRLDVAAGSMVLILGGSGAGKTTFMNAVMGYEQAEAQIRYDNVDIYQEYERMKFEIGYVPQQDLMRDNDSAFETLVDAAQMRLPSNMTPAQHELKALETLRLLGLERERDTLVRKLSGGQRKRLSIGVEYVGNPALFFLDEPDSGLDGASAKALMQNLRDIANEGRIVMVISHSPDRAFKFYDKIIVLAKSDTDNSGHLVFTGTPQEGLDFFEVEALEDIVRRINRPDEGGDGMADHYINLFNKRGGR